MAFHLGNIHVLDLLGSLVAQALEQQSLVPSIRVRFLWPLGPFLYLPVLVAPQIPRGGATLTDIQNKK